MSENAARPEPAAPAPGGGSRRRIILAVVIVVALVAGAFGFERLRFARTHVATDNAQVEGHVIPILTRVGGYVAEVNADDNQRVAEGALLVRIDERDLRARLQQTEADLAAAVSTAGTKAQVGQAAAQLQAARASVAQAEANAAKAASDLQRYQTLAARNIVSRQQLDAAVAADAAAKAQLQAAREQVVAAGAGVRGAESRVASAQAAREQAALQLSYARITAPVTGVVTRRSVEVGQLVQPGQPVMSLVPLEDVWVVANLKETEVRDVTPDDPVKITVDSYPGHDFQGHVESLSPATGARFSLLPPDNATGNFTKVVQRIPVRIHVDGPHDPQRPLRPGMSVRVEVKTR